MKNPTPPALPPKSTRHALLDILKREGPTDAKSLSLRLGITPMAVGLHLASLEEEKLVSARPEPPVPGRRGRPVSLWALTEAADRAFPDAHALLTVGLLESLREVYGEGGVEKLMEARNRHQRAEYARSIPAEAPVREKVKALARLRDREGYMTEVRPEPGGGWLLIENHCPICTAAKACRGMCQSEWQVFRDLMGPGATVSREEHLLSGGRRCVYGIKPAAAGTRAGETDGAPARTGAGTAGNRGKKSEGEGR